MNERDFCYWLKGFTELTNSESLSDEQWAVVKDHLKLVFDKLTPTYDFVKPLAPFPPEYDWGSLDNPLRSDKVFCTVASDEILDVKTNISC
ncbi:MAG TPA: hypothetical protein VMW36_00745 [Patescibacteria group bacterium]|nr:hypothetical protein [Patescibacteria group bacterium]